MLQLATDRSSAAGLVLELKEAKDDKALDHKASVR
jgi:hypothetical protein